MRPLNHESSCLVDVARGNPFRKDQWAMRAAPRSLKGLTSHLRKLANGGYIHAL